MMNGMQTVLAGLTSATGTNGLAQGSASGGAGQATANGSAFAALVASLLGGEALPASAQNLTMLSLFSGGAVGAAETAEGAIDEEMSLEAALEQLAAWIGTLSAEMQRKLAADPQVAEWMAMANAELAMSAETDASTTRLDSGAISFEAEEDASGKPIGELLDRLMKALDAEVDQPYLVAAAKQATVVVIQAFAALEVAESGALPSLTGVPQPKPTNGAEGSLNAKASAQQIAALLAQTKGTVETEASPKTDASNANVRWSHLTAMQAKTVLIRVAGAETNATAMPAETAAKSAESAANETNGAMTSNLSDGIKTATPDGVSKPEAAPRMPLTEAAERLNEWVLKHASTGGSLKAETVLKLMPEHLGQVEVKLTMQNGQLAASITTESAMAKDVLESNLAALRANLQSQGVTVERLVVSHQQPSGFQSGMFQEGRQQQRQPAGRDGARDGQGRKEQGAEDWTDVLAVSAGHEAADLGSYGSSFRAEA